MPETCKKYVQPFLKEKFKRHLDYTNLYPASQKNLFEVLYNNFDNEVLSFVSNLIDARSENQLVKCDYENEFFEGDNRSGKYFIFGSGTIHLGGELLLHQIPDNTFQYFSEISDNDFSNFLGHMNITNVDYYGGSFYFSGIINTYNGADYVEFGEADVYNLVNYYFLEEESDVWCKYILESYRFYRAGSFQTAYLMLFIALDSFIELTIEELKNFYEIQFKQIAVFAMDTYLEQQNYPITEFINEYLINDSINLTLVQLDNKKRKLIQQKLDQILELCSNLSSKQRATLIKKLTFFEKIRNTLAHGDQFDLEQLSEEFGTAQRYVMSNELKFDKLYIGLLIELMNILKQISGNIDIFTFSKDVE